MRNLNIDYEQFLSTIDKSNIGFDSIDHENADVIHELDYLTKQSLNCSYIFFIIADKLEQVYPKSRGKYIIVEAMYFILDIIFAFAIGATLTEMTLEGYFQIKYNVRPKKLRSIAILFMRDEVDEGDLPLICARINQFYGR